jgi:glucose-6-phosphate isomerase
MAHLKFDFNNMFSFNIGKAHGISERELTGLKRRALGAFRHLKQASASATNRKNLSLEWMQLPFQPREALGQVKALASELRGRYENVLSLGIGGSYLGLKAAQDALLPSYYNEFPLLRKGAPKIYFEGNNLDPEPLALLLKNLDPKRTAVIVISKSGETTETKAAFDVVEDWLRRGVGAHYGRQVIAITDPSKGSLRAKVTRAHGCDPKSFRSLPLLEGVGGRYSELNIGLLHLALLGVDIDAVLAGARSMHRRCMEPVLHANPALLYAALHVFLHGRKGKCIGIVMPFSEKLTSTADWYTQLLAESTGKKYKRAVKLLPSGIEQWPDTKNVVNAGRTPIAVRGTNDLHSIQQNTIEGENNKAVTFLRIERHAQDIAIPGSGDVLSGKRYSRLLALAQEATEWALVRESRPNCCVIMPELTPFHWGELIFFFEMATAFEGELLAINAYNQPGVETYKNYMYYKLNKPGLSTAVTRQIKASPLVKRKKFVV